MKELLYEIKQWIISSIILFLMDGEMVKEVIKEAGKYKKKVDKNATDIQEERSRLSHAQSNLNNRMEKIERLYNMAIDLDDPKYSRTGSWAVIVIDGKPEYLRFIRLGRKNMMDIARYLKQFDVGDRPVVDSPYGMPDEFFLDELGRDPHSGRRRK